MVDVQRIATDRVRQIMGKNALGEMNKPKGDGFKRISLAIYPHPQKISTRGISLLGWVQDIPEIFTRVRSSARAKGEKTPPHLRKGVAGAMLRNQIRKRLRICRHSYAAF